MPRIKYRTCNTSHTTMTASNGNIFRVTGLLCGEFTGHRWIPLTKASVAELWSRLGNSVTGFMISDESGNRFFPTAVTDYWQDKAACRHEDQRKRQISGLSSMSMVVIVRYLSSGPQLLYTMPWGLQTLKNKMNYMQCEGSYTNDE